MVLLVALQLAFGLDERGEALVGWASLAVSLLFAFEANDLRTASLERRGYKLAGVASGESRDTAELSFLRTWLPQREKGAALSEPAPKRADRVETPRTRISEGEEVIGLFPRA